jgi:hypothetical protein
MNCGQKHLAKGNLKKKKKKKGLKQNKEDKSIGKVGQGLQFPNTF